MENPVSSFFGRVKSRLTKDALAKNNLWCGSTFDRTMRDSEAPAFALQCTCFRKSLYLKPVCSFRSSHFLRNSLKRSSGLSVKTFERRTILAENSPPKMSPEVDLFSDQVKPEDGKLQELVVIEPVPTSTLETILQGVPTSYKRLVATTYKEAKDISSLPSAFVESERVTYCERFDERLQAATRTYRARNESKKIELGEVYSKTNFSTSPKRVLNEKFEPSFEDNVKQDISIDVYGRKKDDKDLKNEIEKLYNA